jgi:hypothetical protein
LVARPEASQASQATTTISNGAEQPQGAHTQQIGTPVVDILLYVSPYSADLLGKPHRLSLMSI